MENRYHINGVYQHDANTKNGIVDSEYILFTPDYLNGGNLHE